MSAAERGCHVLVHNSSSFQVADHDLKQFSVIPSVALIVGLGSSTLKSTEVILSIL